MKPETLDQWNARRASESMECVWLMLKYAPHAFALGLAYELFMWAVS